jgi:hypothetical protein
VAQQCFQAHWPLGPWPKIGERRPSVPAVAPADSGELEVWDRGGKGARHDIRLEVLGRSGAHRRGYLNSKGLEGSEGPKLEGSQGYTGAGWSSRRHRLGSGAAGRGDAWLSEVQ